MCELTGVGSRLRELADAEDEKQKAKTNMLEAEQWIVIANEQVNATSIL